jgi:hypothetical protein
MYNFDADIDMLGMGKIVMTVTLWETVELILLTVSWKVVSGTDVSTH